MCRTGAVAMVVAVSVAEAIWLGFLAWLALL
jgi:hypothetical protein